MSERLSHYEIWTGNETEMFTIEIREAGYWTEDQEVTDSLDRVLRHIPHISWRWQNRTWKHGLLT